MGDRTVPLRILVAGLTAAGKSTHARLLASHYGLPFVSMRSVMATVLRERGLQGADGDWTPVVDESRLLDEGIDREADRRMLERIEVGSGVFDAWALPWLYRGSAAIRVWITADLPSRIQRCRVSAIAKGHPAPEDPVALLQAKDDFSRLRFKRLYGFDLEPSREIFDVIVENSRVMPGGSLSHFKADVERFHYELVTEIERVREGAAAGLTSEHRVPPSRRGPRRARPRRASR